MEDTKKGWLLEQLQYAKEQTKNLPKWRLWGECSKREKTEMKDVETISLKKGERYNWKNQPERLIFIGHNFSGNGFWYQFALISSPGTVWCECQPSDLSGIEPTNV